MKKIKKNHVMNIFYVFKVIRDNACFPFLRAVIGLKNSRPFCTNQR